MLKEVERLQVGDVVSFRGSGAARYRVRRVEVDGQDVRLHLSSHGLELDARYCTGELARLHEVV
jgi:hypothetical protein